MFPRKSVLVQGALFCCVSYSLRRGQRRQAMARAAHKAVFCANMSQTPPIFHRSLSYMHHKYIISRITYESHTLYSMENYCWFIVGSLLIYCWFIVDLLLIFMILLILREHTCIFTTLFVIPVHGCNTTRIYWIVSYISIHTI